MDWESIKANILSGMNWPSSTRSCPTGAGAKPLSIMLEMHFDEAFGNYLIKKFTSGVNKEAGSSYVQLAILFISEFPAFLLLVLMCITDALLSHSVLYTFNISLRCQMGRKMLQVYSFSSVVSTFSLAPMCM